jgi:hypothetical protein
MRKERAAHLREAPESKLLDANLRHLFASWFNRGCLELRRIDWQSPAALLEKLIAYEAVHEIKGWDDLRRRLVTSGFSAITGWDVAMVAMPDFCSASSAMGSRSTRLFSIHRTM